jgi:choline kinase
MPDFTHAVISAAGLGSRLGLDMPKCLLEINHKTIIEYQLELLKDVEDVRIVVGFLEEQVIQKVRAVRNDAVFIRNPLFRTTSSAYSLHLATKDLRDPFLIMDGDLLIEPGSFRRFLRESTGRQSLVGVTQAKTEDAVFVTIQDHHIHKFHRAPRAEFEWCGVAYLSGIRINKDLNFIYEELERHCPLKCCEILCYEIDTPADYHQAMMFFDELSDAASP